VKIMTLPNWNTLIALLADAELFPTFTMHVLPESHNPLDLLVLMVLRCHLEMEISTAATPSLLVLSMTTLSSSLVHAVKMVPAQSVLSPLTNLVMANCIPSVTYRQSSGLSKLLTKALQPMTKIARLQGSSQSYIPSGRS